MKEILSYWDLSLGAALFILGIIKLYKFESFKWKYDKKPERTGNFLEDVANSHAKRIQDRFFFLIYSLPIIVGIGFIYNRLKGNLPNIITFIKDIIDIREMLYYWDISLGLAAVVFGIFRLRKYKAYAKKQGDYSSKKENGRLKISYAIHAENQFGHFICYILIVFGALFVYNRLKGNLPNIITFIKDII